MGRLRVNPPIRVTPTTLIRNGSNLMDVVFASRPATIRENGHDMALLVAYWMGIGYSTQPLQWNPYKAQHDEEGTEISVSTIVLFTFFIALSISLAMAEGILIYIFVHKRKTEMSELRLNNFDYFSRCMQNDIERVAGVPESEKVASIAMHTDEHNEMRVGPFLPSSSED